MRAISLGEIATITAGQSPPGSSYNEDGDGLPFFQGKADFGDVYPVTRKWCVAPKKIADAGDILISVRAPVGPTNIAAERCCIGRGLAAIRPDETIALRDFVHWVIKCREPELVSRGQGSTFAAIAQNDLKSLVVPIPPLDEQRRIVGILNRTARIKRLRVQTADRLREFVSALFIKMFGDRDRINTKFPIRPLHEVAAIGSGATKGRRIDLRDAIDVPYLRVANVQDGYLNLEEIKSITIKRNEREKYRLCSGDLIVTEGGDPDKLGRAAIWSNELDYCAHQNHVFRVRPRSEIVLTDYLREVAGSDYGKMYFLSVAKQTTGIASINKTQLSNFPVPMPPISLQRHFATIISRVRNIAADSGSASKTAGSLSGSLMARLLGGDA